MVAEDLSGVREGTYDAEAIAPPFGDASGRIGETTSLHSYRPLIGRGWTVGVGRKRP